MSKEENVLYNHLAKRIGLTKRNTIRNWRPEVLKNPRTGNNLEIDIYIGLFCVGFEYQGGVHFNDIHRFNNDSDKSRYNDIVKHQISLNSSKGHKITIVEIFENDLFGFTYNNILRRIINTRNYYAQKKLFRKAQSIECLRLFYINSINTENYRINWKWGYIYNKKNPQYCLLLNYELMNILGSLTFFTIVKGSALKKGIFFNKCLRESSKNHIKPFINNDYSFINNIKQNIITNTQANGDWCV